MKSSKVEFFNKVAGKAPSEELAVLLQQIKDQATILLEEVLETKQAASGGDWDMILDGVCDVKFVASELVTQLESVGIDFNGAFEAVCENNNLKYTTSSELANKWLIEQTEKGVQCHIHETEHEGCKFYVVRRNEDNKVMKHNDFMAVDLTSYIPTILLEKK